MAARVRPLRALGQALAENRPHLVGKDFLTPLIPASEYAERRTRVIAEMKPSSLAIFPGNETQFATGSVFHRFRQDPNFQYLSGFLEPSACLLLYKDANGTADQILMVPEKDEFAEKWEGERTGTAVAKEIFGIGLTLPNTPSQIHDTIAGLVPSVKTVYADLEPKTTVRAGPFYNHKLGPMLREAANAPEIKPAKALVEPLRLIKSENEIDCMRTASEISAAAYNLAYKQQFISEHQLHAYLDFMFKQAGCESDAYLAVVAGGEHALTIHYVRNDDLLYDGELVLVDAGGRYGGYCADISRTWPVNGHFSEPQRDLYQAVLNVEKECIKKCTVDQGFSMHDLHRYSEKLMQSELANAGLKLTPAQVRQVYPHSIGHNLGLDVHDVSLPGSTPLRANQVVTVEPGVYVPFDDAFPKHFQGIGIRVEDNVVVGKTTYEVLTEDCGKEIEDLER